MEGIVYLREKIHEYEQKITELQAKRDSLDAAIHETQALLNSARALLDDELRARQTTLTVETLGSPTLPRLANLSLTEAILEIVQVSPGPIHADNVLRQLVQAGIRPKSKAPKNSVVSILLRHVKKGRIRKVGPNLFVGISTETDNETLAGT
jgi:hypothetical protein